MTIQYHTQKFSIGGKTGHYFRPSINGSVGTDEVVKRIAAEGGTVTEADARAVFSVLPGVISHFVSLGYHVNLPCAAATA